MIVKEHMKIIDYGLGMFFFNPSFQNGLILNSTSTIIAEPTFAHRHAIFVWAGKGDLTEIDPPPEMLVHLWWGVRYQVLEPPPQAAKSSKTQNNAVLRRSQSDA